MNWMLLLVGAALIVVVMVDALVTTVAVATSTGPLSGRLSHALWTVGKRLGGERLRSGIGVILTVIVIAVWLLLLWAGWSLVFSAGAAAVVDANDGTPAGFWSRVYYAGTTMFTLGPGNFEPNGAGWQLAAVFALLNGLGMASLAVTYLIPVTSAATERRQLATTIASLGQRPDSILTNAWNGTDFEWLPQHFITLGPEMDLLSQRHLAYPVLHFFHSHDRRSAAAPAIARLDEATTLVRCGVADDRLLPRSVTEPLHASMTMFLDTLRSAFIDPEDEAPPVPSLQALRDAGIPTVQDAVFRERVEALAERRKLLLALVRTDGWSWEDVWLAHSDRQSDPEREQPALTHDRDAMPT